MKLNFPGVDNLIYFFSQLSAPVMRWTDFVEILIIAYLTYHILLWVKDTRAWQLMKGIAVVLVIALMAAVFDMTTIQWIFRNFAGIAVTALVIILQPELRNAMEELGRRNILSSILGWEPPKTEEGRFSDKTINELVRACTEMARVRTGALIVIEQTTPLVEYTRSGIDIDGTVSSQLLINIFEKNTPLHDGAAIIRGNRIIAATCYLPLSSSRLDKNLGTRHRAGMGISEETDALTLIVSEETGYISYTYKGRLWSNVTPEQLRGALLRLQNKLSEEDAKPASRLPLSGIGKGASKLKRAGSSAVKKVKVKKPSTTGRNKDEGSSAKENKDRQVSRDKETGGKEGGAHD